MASIKRRVVFYSDEKGREPLTEWLGKMKDGAGRATIVVKFERLEDGNFGDHGSVGGGVQELRIHFGPGYRVYYRIDGNDVVLLCGGTKRTQNKDVARAKEIWKEHKQK